MRSIFTLFIAISLVLSFNILPKDTITSEVEIVTPEVEIITPIVASIIHEEPAPIVKHIAEPQPKYFGEYKPDICIGVHDYYNSFVHEAKAGIDNISVIVYSDYYCNEYQFDSLQDIVIPVNDLDCESTVNVKLHFETNASYAKLVKSDFKIMLNVTLVDDCLNIEDNIDNITLNFEYDTNNVVYPLTEVERHLVSSLLAWEYGYKNAEEGQRAVVSVVFNRLDYYGGSLHDIIYAKNQFTPANRIDPETGLCESRDIFDYYSHCIDTVDYVAAYGVTIPHSVLFFRTDYYFSWDTVTDYKQIGDTCYSGLTKLIDRYNEWEYYIKH